MSKKRIIILIIFILLYLIGIIYSIFYYNKRYIIKFETGSNDGILNQYLLKGEKVKRPEDPKREGYIFINWESNGEEYNFDKKVNDNLILSAKWLKDEYITIKFNTNTIYDIDDIKIIKGSKIDELPLIKKEGYTFLGWYMNDEEYTNKELYSDTILEAKFEETKEELKIGDIVYIIGPYGSSYDNEDYNTMAIGWDRVILDISKGSENPYKIGNDEGVTGFCKESSIKKSG